ncbi:hypothetical protein APASM_3869 [Actinosynnema pretiosum subsp. pretiosum]|nr:hypothetical protein APASM_3869 [Actinosynnema pretiosum subsp. pretiosum]
MRGTLGPDVVGRLHELLRSEVFSGVAEDALDDTATITGWRSCFTLILPNRPWVVIAPTGDVETESQIAVVESSGHVVRRVSARDVQAPEDPFKDLRGDSGVFCFVIDHTEALEELDFFPRLVSTLCDVADRVNTQDQPDDRPETVLHFVLSGAHTQRSEEALACLRTEGRTVARHGKYLLVG